MGLRGSSEDGGGYALCGQSPDGAVIESEPEALAG
jgi:hypothetical protein